MKRNLLTLFFISSILFGTLSTCSKRVERLQEYSVGNIEDNSTEFENFISFTEGEVTTKISDKNSSFALAESSTKEVVNGVVSNMKLNSGLFKQDNGLGIQIGVNNVSFDKKNTAVDILKTVFSGQLSLVESSQLPFAEISFVDAEGKVWTSGSLEKNSITIDNKGVYTVDGVAYVVVNGSVDKATLFNGEDQRSLANLSFQLTYSLVD